MGEKRFSVRLRSECDEVIYSFFDGDKPLDVDMIVDLLNEQQATITKLRNENIILKNKIEDLRVSLFMQDKELQRQMQKSDLND